MNSSEQSINPELSLREQALAIIDFWKEQGFKKVVVSMNRYIVVPGEERQVDGDMAIDIDNPSVIKFLTQSLEKGIKYEINKE